MIVRVDRGLCRRLKRKTAPALDPVAIGRRVAEARRKHRWRQCDLAAVSGVHGSVIAYIELGRRLPSRDAGIALCVALRRSLEWLYYGLSANGKLWKLSGN
ncbi:MAG: helix-turn-helix transcriptional regulator [Phycisphaerae bacterium]